MTLAATAPSAIAISVRSATHVGSGPVNCDVGESPLKPMVADAAPMISSAMQDSATPKPAHQPVARRLVSGAK